MKPKQKIKKTFIKSNKRLLDAMRVINKNTIGICFVVDNKFRLIGVITDGDLRRAAIKKISFKEKISKICNPNFISFYYKEKKYKILKSLNSKIRHIPLTDKSGRLVDYVSDSSNISLAKPELSGNEIKYLNDCIKTGWISSNGLFVKKFQDKFSKYTKIKNCLAVSNGTTALHLALKTIGITSNDEVIVPNLTFASPVNTIIHCGGKPVFVDVKENTYCINDELIEKKITKKTKAIIVVHLYGHPANLNKIVKLAKKYKLYLIEDCAEALGSFFEGKHVGNFGDIATFSFFGNKLITTGEGGMIGFKSKILREKAEILKDHGMSKKLKYWHTEVGFNFRLTNIQSAIGLAQMERIEWFLNNRLTLVKNYNTILKNLDFIELPGEYGKVKNSYWLYTIRLKNSYFKFKDKLLKYLVSNKIEARPIFYPMHLMPPYKKFIKKKNKFPVSLKLFNSSISLPSAFDVTKKDIKKIFELLKSFDNQTKLIRK